MYQTCKNVFDRVREHRDHLESLGYEWVMIALQGSQNYELEYEFSDVDTKAIILPKFEDVVLAKSPFSSTLILENNEHIDVKDIRLSFELFKKQNPAYVELLFSKYVIINPKYSDITNLFEINENIARYNNLATVSAIKGMMMEKRKALQHPYPTIKDKIEKYGFDPKQLHHLCRLEEFLRRYISGERYSECLISKNKEYLMFLKHGNLNCEEAIALADEMLNSANLMVDKYRENNSNPDFQNKDLIDSIIKNTLLLILKKFFKEEITEG